MAASAEALTLVVDHIPCVRGNQECYLESKGVQLGHSGST
jgi:hypothetical protein